MSSIEPYGGGKDAFLSDFASLRPDLFFPEEWTDDQREMAAELVRPSRVKHTMFSAIPMNCEGPLCEYASTCPLMQKNIAPMGKPCPIEMSIIFTLGQELCREWGVDQDNMSEMGMVRDYVDQEVQQLRKTKILAKEHFIQENVAGIDADGNVITKKELHMAIPYEDAIHRRKERIRNAFLATREARAKIGQGNLDPAQAVANLLDSLRDKEVETQRLIAQKMGLEYHDPYLDADDVIEVEVDEEEEGEETASYDED